jgi:hypothetical protein
MNTFFAKRLISTDPWQNTIMISVEKVNTSYETEIPIFEGGGDF